MDVQRVSVLASTVSNNVRTRVLCIVTLSSIKSTAPQTLQSAAFAVSKSNSHCV
jgi:hypothetical protein